MTSTTEPHRTKSNAPVLMTPTEVCAWFGISRSTLYLWVAQNRVPSIKLGGSLLRSIALLSRFCSRAGSANQKEFQMVARRLNGDWYVDTWIEIPGRGRERIRKRSPIQTKKGTERYEAEIVEAALCQSSRRAEKKFDDFAVEFLENHVRANCKYSTLVAYESVLSQHLVPWFRNMMVHVVSERDIAALKAELLAGDRSPKTVHDVLAVLSSMLHVAREWGYLQHVPRIRYPKASAQRFRFLTPHECDALEAAATDHFRDMIHVARKTGLRIGELTALDWEQIDLARARIVVDRAVWRGKVSTPKGGRSRAVDLSPKTVKRLAELFDRSARCGLVFPSERGLMRDIRKCDAGLRRTAKRAAIEPFGWHVLRHTYASHLVMAGVALPVVQQLLGHTDIRLTMRYAHLSPSHRIHAVAKLDEDPLGQ